MDRVLNIFFVGRIFVQYYITQTKIFMVKVEEKRLKRFHCGHLIWDGGSILCEVVYVITVACMYGNLVIHCITIKLNL